MPNFGLATLNHSPLHGVPTQWEAHLDAAATAGFDGLAPDIFWLRALEAEGVALETLAAGLRDRGLGCMEVAGIAIGDAETTRTELEEQRQLLEGGLAATTARIHLAATAERLQPDLVCPITQEIMQDPVVSPQPLAWFRLRSCGSGQNTNDACGAQVAEPAEIHSV